MRKAQLIDVFGELLFQGERHGPSELDAAAGGQFRLRQQNLRGRRKRHDLAGARHRRRQGKGPRCFAVVSAPVSSMVSHSVSSWPGAGRRSSSVCGMALRCSERAQQRRYLAAVPSQQKTVQGELRSAKGDARGQPEILAGGAESAR